MEIVLKSALIAVAMLIPTSIASAQAAKPSNTPLKLEINQVLGFKKISEATYELSARLEDGSIVDLRMNTFVAQDLSRQLGNFSRQ
jgi:hypothetical protein